MHVIFALTKINIYSCQFIRAEFFQEMLLLHCTQEHPLMKLDNIEQYFEYIF